MKTPEKTVNKFFITIRHADQIFGKFEKFEIKLDTSKNIVNQAENITSTILDSFEVPKNFRENISWKIYRDNGDKYMMVSKSRNWQEG